MNYKKAFLSLFPTGRAWNTESTSVFHKLAMGISLTFERAQLRAEDLLKESDPRTCNETLEDWERIYGLPDKCDINNNFSLEKRLRVVNRSANFKGGQSPKYFEDYIKTLGFDASVYEYREFRAGRSCAGDPLSNGIGWVNTWQINLSATLSYSFSAGISTAGEPLRVFRNESVECSIDHIKPAHSKVIFAFSE